jgi:D-tyrosyl-tRNA(Tyr) deacylase
LTVRAVVQRVTEARVVVSGEEVGRVGPGLVALVGAARGDGDADADALADKLAGLRVFADGEGKMNRSVVDIGGSVLVVSQFTLAADVRRGRRPSFTGAAAPEEAELLVDRVVSRLVEHGIACSTGRFAAHMQVELTNDGPVTIVIDTSGGRVV